VLEVTACAGEPDERVSLEIYNAVWPHEAVTMDAVASFQATARDYTGLLAYSGGTAVGSAAAAILPQRPHRVFALITVLAGHRRGGAGSALYQAVSAWAADRGITELEAAVSDDDPGSLAFARRRGFTEEVREVAVTLDLTGMAPPQVPLPEGIEIVTWAQRPDLGRGIYEAAAEGERDIPGAGNDEVEPFEDWQRNHFQGPGYSPGATFVAVAGEEVAGFAMLSLTAAQPAAAYHALTAVRRSWRGRGVARAVKAAQITWALENGYRQLHTRNEERNEPIRRLNAYFGYRPGTGRIYLVGPLAGEGHHVGETPAGGEGPAGGA
jgi:GNAT superfamily N-acetyltransferase